MLLWYNLDHKHILPLLGIDREVFRHASSMVLPWVANGHVRQYLDRLTMQEGFPDQQFILIVNQLVRPYDFVRLKLPILMDLYSF